MNIRYWMVLLVAGTLIGRGMWKNRPREPFSLPLRDPAQAESSSPCYGKEKCVVVFVTPWCGACEQTFPVIVAISQKWTLQGMNSKNGLRVIVGKGSADKGEKLAKRFGSYASIDVQNQLFVRYEVHVFPTWIIFDALGRELSRFEGGTNDVGLTDAFIAQMLKL